MGPGEEVAEGLWLPAREDVGFFSGRGGNSAGRGGGRSEQSRERDLSCTGRSRDPREETAAAAPGGEVRKWMDSGNKGKSPPVGLVMDQT